MSFAWAFYTVSVPRWESCFQGAHTEKAQAFLSALTWDEAVDQEAARFAADHLARNGLEYSGLSEDDACLIDECISLLTSEEGLGHELEREAVSPDFVHPSAVEKLLRAAEAAKVRCDLLPLLRSGRRYGAVAPSSTCNYCVLTPSESAGMVKELSSVLASTKGWGKDAWIPDLVRECLVQPLTKAAESERLLLGLLG